MTPAPEGSGSAPLGAERGGSIQHVAHLANDATEVDIVQDCQTLVAQLRSIALHLTNESYLNISAPVCSAELPVISWLVIRDSIRLCLPRGEHESNFPSSPRALQSQDPKRVYYVCTRGASSRRAGLVSSRETCHAYPVEPYN